ncbi:MAG: tRNA adenosine(34) deaminase TadA [Gammaproteobacteria bacterium]
MTVQHTEHEAWMRLALAQADLARARDEVPVGAVLVNAGQQLAAGYNQPITANDPTAHAEIVALRSAALVSANYRLPGSVLYVTIEPCTMCIGALIHARVDTLVFGAAEPRAGAVVSQLSLADKDFFNHRIQIVSGVLEIECAGLMKDFFAARRRGKT